MKQLFFRADDANEAWTAAKQEGVELFAIYDKRSKNPSDRMYVLTVTALLQLQGSKLWKRMWSARRIQDKGAPHRARGLH